MKKLGNIKFIEKVKKWKKKKRIVVALGGFFLVCLAVFTILFFCLNQQSEIDEVELKSNQKMIYGTITELYGNEITYQVLDKSETLSSDVVSDEVSTNEMPSGDFGGGEMPSGDFGGGEMPSGDFGGGEMPSGDFGGGEMPSGDFGGGMPTRDDTSDTTSDEVSENPSNHNEETTVNGRNGLQSGGMGDTTTSSTSSSTYHETGESVTANIPVGTTVTTKLGTVTTFSRLAVGDTVSMIIETLKDGTEMIMSIEIIE